MLPFFVILSYYSIMISLDGKKLSQKILAELKQEIADMAKKLRLAVVVIGQNPVTQKFIQQKQKAAQFIGVDFRIFPFEETVATDELRKRIAQIVHEKKNTGVIIQLPLPEHLNVQYILNSVTPEKDVDMLSARSIGNLVAGKSEILPPVDGAIKAFFEEYGINYKSKYITVIGAGKLVGLPVSLWLLNEKTTFSVLRSTTPNISEFTKKADIIISGVGKPKLITGDMIKEGAVVIDAGTSESEGPSTGLGTSKIVGDTDFESCAEKASYITPVPGGVGPVTVAILFRNLLTLAKAQKK